MSRKARKNVGVIGLGIIGTRVAAGLRAAGYQAYVWNRSAKPAPNFLGSPEEIAEAAEIIQIFVADAAALFDVIEAMGAALTPRHVIVCSATVGPEAVLEAAQIVESKGAQFLDAPFTGSKLAAEKRQLVYYIGGSEAAFLKARPVLEASSKAIVRIGEVGHAATVKVVTNMISAVSTQVLAEALSIVQKAGLEPEVLAAAIEQNACRSGVMDLKLPKMITGDYDPHFSLKHMFKDVQLGIHMANALDIEVPATTVTAGVMYGAINKGWADLDFSALFKNYAPVESADEFPALPGMPRLAEDSSEELEGFSDAGPEKVVEELSNDQQPATANGPAGIQSLASLIASVPAEAAPEGSPSVTADSTHGTNGNEAAPSAAALPRFDAAPPVIEVEKSNLEPMREQGLVDGKSAPSERDSGGAVIEGGGILEVERQPASAKGPSNDGDESPGRPNNFVRRWFVARSGG